MMMVVMNMKNEQILLLLLLSMMMMMIILVSLTESYNITSTIEQALDAVEQKNLLKVTV